MTTTEAVAFESRDILGLSIMSGSRTEVAAALADRITTQIRTQIAFVNAHLSNACRKSQELRDALGSFILLNDGFGLDLAGRLLHGRSFAANLNGTDFVPILLDQPRHNWRIFLFGSQEEVVAQAAVRFRERWPHHTIVGFAHGYSDPDAVATQIRDCNAHLVLVATGNPRQEEWIAKYVPSVCNCAIAVGAWFDFLTGRVPRAPVWLRELRCEWVFRLCLEPRRLARRYLIGNVLFLARVMDAKFGSALSIRWRTPAL